MPTAPDTRAARRTSSSLVGVAWVLLAAALFASAAIAGVYVPHAVSRVTVADVRMLGGGAALTVLWLSGLRRRRGTALGRQRLKVSAATRIGTLTMTAVGLAGFQALYFLALARASVAVVAAVSAAAAAGAAGLLDAATRRRRPATRWLLTSTIAAAAATVVVVAGEPSGGWTAAGVAFAAVAGCSYGTHTLVLPRVTAWAGAAAAAAGTLTVAGVLFAPALRDLTTVPLRPAAVGALLWLATGATGGGYLALGQGLRRMTGAQASLGLQAQPLFAALLAWLLLGQPLPMPVLVPTAVLALSGLVPKTPAAARALRRRLPTGPVTAETCASSAQAP